MRVGIGYDVHQFAEGRKCVLGGVEFPGAIGLDGHSDADVLLHAIMDAILGAAGLGDIGQQFPNTDPKFKDVSSLELLRHTVRLINEAGLAIGNIDSSLIAEQPKIGPKLDEMRSAISEAAGIQKSQIGIKATTNETLGFIGRNEGAAAMAVALLISTQEST